VKPTFVSAWGGWWVAPTVRATAVEISAFGLYRATRDETIVLVGFGEAKWAGEAKQVSSRPIQEFQFLGNFY